MSAPDRQNKPKRRLQIALAALLFGATMTGVSPILVRLSEVGPIATGFYRVFLVLPLFALWQWWMPSKMEEKASKQGYRTGCICAAAAGACFAMDLTFWHSSLTHISVANATLLDNMAPVFVVLIAWLIWREKISIRFLGSLVAALIGVWALVLGDGRQALENNNVILGSAQGLTGAVFYAGYILLIKQARYSASSGHVMLISTAATVLVLLPLMLIFEDVYWPETIRGFIVLLVLAWLVHGAAQSLITYSMSSLPAVFSSLVLLIQPVAAAFLAWWLFNEALTALQIAGGILVITAVLLAKR